MKNNQLIISSNRCTQHDGLTGADNQANYSTILMKRIFSPTLSFSLFGFHFFNSFLLIFSTTSGILRRIIWTLVMAFGVIYSGCTIYQNSLKYFSYPSSIKPMILVMKSVLLIEWSLPLFEIIRTHFIPSNFFIWNQGRDLRKLFGVILFITAIAICNFMTKNPDSWIKKRNRISKNHGLSKRSSLAPQASMDKQRAEL